MTKQRLTTLLLYIRRLVPEVEPRHTLLRTVFYYSRMAMATFGFRSDTRHINLQEKEPITLGDEISNLGPRITPTQVLKLHTSQRSTHDEAARTEDFAEGVGARAKSLAERAEPIVRYQ